MAPVDLIEGRQNLFYDKLSKKYGQLVEFDISVISTKGKKKKEGIGVNFGNIGFFSRRKLQSSKTNQNRINFKIGIVLPTAEASEEEDKLENILNRERLERERLMK